MESTSISSQERTFFNYKKTNNIELMALAYHEYIFSYIEVGAHGRDVILTFDYGAFLNGNINILN